MRSKTRVALLIGRGSRVPGILHCLSKIKNTKVVFVLSCIGEDVGVKAAKKRRIATGILKWEDYKSKDNGRNEFSARARNLLKSHNANFIVMAGWRVIMPESFIKEFSGLAINIHPSILPSYRGDGERAIKAQWEARWDRDAPPVGCTLHYVDEGIDTGEPIMRGIVYPRDYRTLEEFSDAIHKKEDEVLCEGLKKLLKN
jgi:phosphoribosylglycinamide formyltransferase-1